MRLTCVPCFGLIAGLFSVVVPAVAQETSIGYRVWVDRDNPKMQLIAPAACQLYENGVRNESCPAKGVTNEPRAVTDRERFGGWANIYKDATDSGLLHVNFWPPKCGKKLPPADLVACRANSDSIRLRRYVLKFSNRQSQMYRSSALHVRALTLPLKFRSGYSDDTITVRSRAEAGISGNIFVGHRFGWEKYYYERGAARNPYTRFHITPGAFVGASVVSVGKETSKTAAVQLTETTPIGAISFGPGVLLGWRNFSLGIFRGWDFGLGDVADDWDFDRRPYWALGITLDSFLEGAKL